MQAYAGLTFKSVNYIDPVDGPGSRLQVTNVDAGSPAQKAGVKVNDQVTYYNTNLVQGNDPWNNKDWVKVVALTQLNDIIHSQPPGSIFVLELFRPSDPVNLPFPIAYITLGTAVVVPPSPTPGKGYVGLNTKPYYGFPLWENAYELATWTHHPGSEVIGIDAGSPAYKAGMRMHKKNADGLDTKYIIYDVLEPNGSHITIDNNYAINDMFQSLLPGTEITISAFDANSSDEVLQKQSPLTFKIKLGYFPGSPGSESTGTTTSAGTPVAPPINPDDVKALDSAFHFLGDFFTPAYGPDANGNPFLTTADQLAKYLRTVSRDSSPPTPPNPWEMAIGACKFSVPPVNIQVSRAFQTGTLGGGAIRQIVPPKFNSGHSETVIDIKLYFPNQASIWGYAGDSLDIDFTTADTKVIDGYLSSLRGLVTAFRYSPILPIDNKYLNSTFNITSVALKTLNISTESTRSDSGADMPFPFCIVVNLQMLAFDHSVYLPMVTELKDAMDWGRYRIYMGRCAHLMENAANKQFTTADTQGAYQGNGPMPANPNELAGYNDPNSANYDPIQSGNATAQFSVNKNLEDSTNVQFYYPPKDPAGQVPDFLTLNNFKPNMDDTAVNKSWWDVFTSGLGLSQGSYGTWSQVAKYFNDPNLSSQFKVLQKWLEGNSATYSKYSTEQMNAYVADRTKGLTGAKLAQAKIEAQQTFLANAANEYLTGNPTLQNLFNAQAFLRGQSLIDEWDVPMAKLSLDSNNIRVISVSTQTVNNFARLALSMRDAPTYQHIGGLGTTIEILLYAKGEDDLTQLRLMYDSIANLSRLEHTHAVLGFLGLKNIIIALAGTKYVLPMSFEVETIKGMPHTYSIKMTFTDFDVFQQKREMISSEQQSQLIERFGKANPFLRLKQSWAAFNAYPDLPLAVFADEDTTNGGFQIKAGDMVGHLDPDFYFNSYATIDDDLATLPDASKNASKYGTTGSANYSVVHHIGTWNTGSDATGDQYSIGLNDGYWDLCTNGEPHITKADGAGAAGDKALKGLSYNEPHTGNTHSNPFVTGLAPSSLQQTPNYHTSADGSQSTTGLVDGNFKLMMKDQAYRDQNGRMVRAFPTYMLWLINEGGLFAGQQLFDNFYGLQSLIDFSFVDNEDVMGTTLILRVSNLYSRLSTTYSQQVDANYMPEVATMINPTIDMTLNLKSGTTNTTVLLDTITLQPGARLHMRAGYGSDPNLLETIFNGTVTSVQVGDIMTITAQSDAIEFGAVINNTNTSGTSADLTGSIESGLWFSEPRDLMVRLMTMGGSTSKEAFAQAHAGMIFSENRFGIRHFGRILYDSMTPNESAFQQARETAVKGTYNTSSATQFANQIASTLDQTSEDPSSLFNPFSDTGNLIDLLGQMWNNFSSAKDMELYKRNIYPGNGTGVGQYTGGDLGDGGTATAFAPTGILGDGTIPSLDANGQPMNSMGVAIPGTAPSDPMSILIQANQEQFVSPADSSGRANGNTGLINSLITDVGSVFSLGASNSGWFQSLLSVAGVTNPNGNLDSGAGPGMGGTLMGKYSGPFAEVSFRAHTYMKTVWDMFLVCAALLPNYIVAVRPFEERSTVFYGKPHWAYTSGVLPVSTGRTHGSIDPSAHVDANGKPTSLPGTPVPANPIYGGSGKFGSKTDINSALGKEWMRAMYGRSSKAADVYTSLTDISTREWTDVIQKNARTIEADPNTTASSSTQTSTETSSGVSSTDTSSTTLSTDAGALSKFLYAMRTEESGGDYTANNPKGGANGAYQFIQSTWDAHAAAAGHPEYVGNNPATVPSAIQDAVAGQMATDYWNAKKDWRWVAQCWYYPAWAGPDLTHQNDIPREYNAAGEKINSLTMKDLSDKIMVLMGDPRAGANTTSSTADSTNLNVTSYHGVANWVPADLPLVKDVLESYSAQFGAIRAIPVDFSSTDKTNTEGLKSGVYKPGYDSVVGTDGKVVVDVLGSAAETLYTSSRTPQQADTIWNLFRNLDGHGFGSGPANDRTWDKSAIDVKTYFLNNFTDQLGKDKVDAGFEEVMAQFRQFMWTHAYHRGWIVLTADAYAATDVTTNQFFDDVWNAAVSLFGGHTDTPTYIWTFARAFDLFKVYVGGTKDGILTDAGTGSKAAIIWMQANAQGGYSSTNFLTRAIELAGRGFTNTVGKGFAEVFGAINTIGKTIADTLRMSLALISGGMNLAFYAGGQANLLNSLLNDSIYYDAQLPGGIGGLDWLCDNPFTREYGEPVIEIREPFQRVHYLNSFQHIIANGIVESSDQVATVVTCTSDGQHPVTASFDKGAPAERQLEITVDDGLMWQAPNGISSIFHPLKLVASFISHYNNGDDATNANRVARSHLKENLKNIYTGELIIVGNAQIRTHDLVYLYDSYERMYGLFEVEQVVHQFNSEMGFITSITPNAIVTINDPAKFQFGSMIHRQAAAQSIRNSVRMTLTNGQQGQNLSKSPDQTTLNNYANSMAQDLLGTTQYTGGIGALVKDIGSTAGIPGAVIAHPAASAAGNLASAETTTDIVGGVIGTNVPILAESMLKWPAFSWLRDNLFDAHACYIQYLNRNGTPMDAGLSYNFGTAVGQTNVLSLFADTLKVPVDQGGESTVSTADLLTNLGWANKDVLKSANSMSSFADYSYNQVLKLSGKVNSTSIISPPTTAIVTITELIEATTFNISPSVLNLSEAMLAYVLAPDKSGQAVLNDPSLDANLKAMNYIQGVAAQIYASVGAATVAVRVDTNNPSPGNDKSKVLVTVFYRLPEDTAAVNDTVHDPAAREAKLLEMAKNYGGIGWDDYMSNGHPYTLNKEMVDRGLVKINASAFGGGSVPITFNSGG